MSDNIPSDWTPPLITAISCPIPNSKEPEECKEDPQPDPQPEECANNPKEPTTQEPKPDPTTGTTSCCEGCKQTQSCCTPCIPCCTPCQNPPTNSDKPNSKEPEGISGKLPGKEQTTKECTTSNEEHGTMYPSTTRKRDITHTEAQNAPQKFKITSDRGKSWDDWTPPENLDTTQPTDVTFITSRPGDLFVDPGFEEPIGYLPFETLTPTPREIAKQNEYEDESETWFSVKPELNPPPEQPVGPIQFSPTYTKLPESVHESIEDGTTLVNSKFAGHDPDSITWISPAQWTSMQWDGTPFDLTGKSKSQICSWLTDNGSPYIVRGLRERFYEVNPFQDNSQPTVAEIDAWNLEAIRHIRSLFGISTPVIPDARLYIECVWADERKHTTVWDSKYSDTFSCIHDEGPPKVYGSCFDRAPGPCHQTIHTQANSHCGAAFFPDATDRAPYHNASPYGATPELYPELSSHLAPFSGVEGISGANMDLPWSIKMAAIVARWICLEGQTGHPGPYLAKENRQYFGCSWRSLVINGKDVHGFRGKWR